MFREGRGQRWWGGKKKNFKLEDQSNRFHSFDKVCEMSTT
jgi:hypothetical protein